MKAHLPSAAGGHVFLRELNPNTRPSLPACNEIWGAGQQSHWVRKEEKKEVEETAFVSWLALVLLSERGSGSHTVDFLCPEYSCLLRSCQLAVKRFFPIKGLRVHSALEAEALCWWSVDGVSFPSRHLRL